jgi:hypothetical protein
MKHKKKVIVEQLLLCPIESLEELKLLAFRSELYYRLLSLGSSTLGGPHVGLDACACWLASIAYKTNEASVVAKVNALIEQVKMMPPPVFTDQQRYDLFHLTECEQCGGDLRVRAMSWFTHQIICGVCWEKENVLRLELFARGVDLNALEGCGYIPKLEKIGHATTTPGMSTSIGGERPKHGK